MEIKALTSLRFFAALMVVLSHLTFLANSESQLLSGIYRNVLSEGYIGVTFFFILSGFILSHSYADRIKNRHVDGVNFFSVRIARIFPVHILTFIFAIPLIGLPKNAGDAAGLLPNILLAQSYFPYKNIYFSANAPSWSLSNELFFYALFPLIITKRNWFIFFIAIGSIMLQVVAICFSSSVDDTLFFTYIFPPSRLFDFIIGIYLYRLRIYANLPERIKNATAFQVFSLGSLVVFFLLRNNSIQALRYDLYYALPMAFVVISFSLQSGVIAEVISSKFLVLLGNASFSLYLIHQLVIRYGNAANVNHLKLSGVVYDVAASILYIFVSAAISVLVFNVFEQRAKELVSNKLISLNERLRLIYARRRTAERV